MPQFRYLFGVLLVSIFLLSSNTLPESLQLANESVLTISGRVMLDGKTIDKIKISIFQDNQLIDSIFSGPSGKFNFDLLLNYHYALIFDNFGDYQKTLVIETFIPEGITNVKPYRCIIRLDAEFVTDQENAELYLDYPIGIVKFDQGSGMFELDYHYSRSRIKEVK